MNISMLKGTGVALVTPFHEDYTIDYQGLKNLLTHTYHAGKGVEYWVVQGTTGESPTLSNTEKGQVLDFVRNNNPNNVPIVYGIGGNNTQSVVENIKKPVKVIACGNRIGIRPEYIEIALKTNGSLHFMNEDVIDLTPLRKGKPMMIHGKLYAFKNGWVNEVVR
ncbi:MAG: hypothetical protein EAZ20_12230 [Bacteroidetes bacterium]|nr:MAG: hypothetical protein EAZ20_12230 [Bacteroidota bacterium]